MKNQKGNTMLIVLVIAAIVLVGGYLFYKGGTMPSGNQPSSQVQQQSNAIQNDSELMSASSDLDSTNVDSMDNQLNQNTTDASSF
jgi:predicted negative regulator of RcsB-dependent stress response